MEMLKYWFQTGFLNTPPSAIGQDKQSRPKHTSMVEQMSQNRQNNVLIVPHLHFLGKSTYKYLQLSNTLIWDKRRYFKIQHTQSFVKALSVRVYQRHQAKINRQDYQMIVNSKA